MKGKCKKRGFKDKDHAIAIMHKICNIVDGRQKPIRTYQCDMCGKYHLTKAEIDKQLSEEYKVKLDWTQILIGGGQ